MNGQHAVPPDAPEVQLLAFVLSLRRALAGRDKVRATIPRSVYDAVPAAVFQELVHDSLSQWAPDAPTRLTLIVRPVDTFMIERNIEGD